ncbi:MAG: pyridoxal phosphate-dependent aminotransferase [Candidatus Dormibacteria bacterium]
MSRHRRPSLGVAFGYVPGEQPPDGESWVKLNTNESPLPPSPSVAPAVAAAAAVLQRYPDPAGEPLRSALARHHGVDTRCVVLGNGADALLAGCLRAWCEPGSTAVLTVPTYSLLATLARLYSVDVVEVPVDEQGRPHTSFAGRAASLRVLVNPNAPTGTWLAPDQVEAACAEAPGVTVIDEAYADFAPASVIPLLHRHPSWVVVRTFSKSYSLAGLRVGYAVAAPDLIEDLVATGDSYALDRCAIAGAAAALADAGHHSAVVGRVLSERERLTTALTERGWDLTVSRANFVCGTPPGGAEATFARLRSRRILVRHFPAVGAGLLRITVGSPQENDAVVAALP